MKFNIEMIPEKAILRPPVPNCRHPRPQGGMQTWVDGPVVTCFSSGALTTKRPVSICVAGRALHVHVSMRHYSVLCNLVTDQMKGIFSTFLRWHPQVQVVKSTLFSLKHVYGHIAALL